MNQKSKKIYGIPFTLTQLISEELANCNDRVLLLVIERMAVKARQMEIREEYSVNENWHACHKIAGLYDKGCGCAYCRAVHKYVETKVSAHRLRRKIDNYDYMCRPYENTLGYKQLKELEKEWPKLRELSHLMRDRAGL